MTVLPIKITRYVDSNFPGWVECEFLDSADRRHAFLEKIPVVTTQSVFPESAFPLEGVIACEIVSTWRNSDGALLAKIDTSRPWRISSSEGVEIFDVLASKLVEIS